MPSIPRPSSPFIHPWFVCLSDFGPLPLPVHDYVINQISYNIRQKKDWYTKKNDKDIVAKWRSEIKCQTDNKNINKLFDFAIDELEWYHHLESTFAPEGHFQIQFDDKIVVSDTVVPSELKASLREQSEKLYNLYGEDLDYHPGSNNQVVDLVHPSLYPLQYGKTPFKNVACEIQIKEYDPQIKKFKNGISPDLVQENYQWIPSLFERKGDRFELKSYINNLHPIKFKALYDIIEDVFNLSIPGLEIVLSRYASPPLIRTKVPDPYSAYNEEYQSKLKALFDQIVADTKGAEDDYNEFENTRHNYVKEAEIKYTEPETTRIDLKGMRNLKVIPKMANIELTPENPEYKGGSWHIEGTINEDIVATILYYYDSENISDSRLSFRCTFDEPPYEQNDNFYVEHFYGLKDEEELNKYVGAVECKEDRILIFPNIFQHHVDPFELKDKTRSGHRKILCLFVVDPYDHLVVSTDQVPPQQKEWWEDETLESYIGADIKEKVSSLQIPGWPQTLKEAKEVREILMKERSNVAEPFDVFEDNVVPFIRPFSLCEH